MLRLGLTAALLLCACSIDNPFFGLLPGDGPETGDEATAGATTPATTAIDSDAATVTSEIAETTATTTSPGTTPTTGPDTEATLSTLATTAETSGSSSTGEPPYVCELAYNATPTRVALDLEVLMNPWLNCEKQAMPQKLSGYGRMEGGALKFSIGPCNNMDDMFKLQLGSGYEAPDRFFCGDLSVYWVKEAEECTIAALYVQEVVNDVPGSVLYAASYAPTAVEPNFPYGPMVPLAGSCGCEFVDMGCCEYDPGYRNLKLDEVIIPPGEAKEVPTKGIKFFNYNATVEPSCEMSGVLDMRLEWFAYAL
jgi:hypothetical protein